MPVIIGAALVAGAVSAGVAAVVGTAIGTAFLTAFATSLVLGGLQKVMQKTPSNTPPVAAAQARLTTIRQPIPARQIWIGEAAAGGAFSFYHKSADGNEHFVITLACHRMAEMIDVYFGSEIVQLDGSGNATGRYAGYVRIQKSLGDEGSTQPFPDLVSESEGKWTSDCLQQGHSKIYIRLTPNADLFPSGLPNVSVFGRGDPTIVDSRTGTAGYTNNAALVVAHYLSTNSAYGFSSDFTTEIDDATLDAQASICDERVLLATATATFTADATLDALSLATGSRIPRAGDGVRVASAGTLPSPLAGSTTYYVIAAPNNTLKLATSFANAMAGTAIDLADAGSGTHTLTYYDEPRYRINGTFLATEKRRAVLERLLNAMAGYAVRPGAKWWIYAGAYDAPTLTFSEKHVIGKVRTQPLASRREVCNAVKGFFVDPSQGWQPTSFPAIVSSTYLADDGGERIFNTLDLSSFVNSPTQAQRIAKIALLKARQPLTVTVPMKLTAYRAMTGRTLALDNTQHGWSGKAFEIEQARFIAGQDGSLAVEFGSLRETAAAIYDWSTSDERAVDIAPNTTLPDPRSVGTPSVPTVTEEIYSTSGSAGIKSKALVSWSAPSGVLVDRYQLEYKLSTDTTWSVRPLTRSLNDEIIDLAPLFTYDFRVKALNGYGVGGSYSPTAVKEMRGLLAAPEDVANFSVQSYAGLAKFLWTATTSIDVRQGGKVFVRWTPLTTGGVWNKGSLINPDGFPGADTSGFGPLYTGTYMAKFRDSTGHYSANEASFVVTEALITGLSTIATATFHPLFAGTKTDTVVVDSALQITASTLWDDMPGNIDDWGLVDYLGGINPTGSCIFNNKLDMASVQSARLYTTLKSEGFDTGEQWDYRTDMMDDWGLVDGSVIEDAEVKIMVRTTDDDPAGASPTWGPWHQLNLVADYHCRGFEFRADFTSATVTHNRRISELTIAAKH